MVLQWEKGSLYVDPQFTGRARLPKEGIPQDDLSLVLKNTLHEDQGHYLCFFVKDQKIQPAAQVNLTVTDHLTRVMAGSGSSVLFPLHTAAAVSVWFLPDGGNDTVPVCEVEEDQLECEVGGTVLHSDSLELEKLSLLDSGTFSVMERGSQRTVSVLVLQVFPTGDSVVKAGSAAVVIITAVFLGISVVTVVIAQQQQRWWRWWRRRSKVKNPDHTDATSSNPSLKINIQSSAPS
ncbi:uncharacterized protein [Salminus brasiliensis]|uniref:uncharacterized protein n=1 Tax=Salminus brasiliensis TaxID=930266 RepID=UPI003B82E5FE